MKYKNFFYEGSYHEELVEEYEAVKCTEDHFPSEVLPEGMELNNFVCPSFRDRELVGNKASANYTSFKIMISEGFNATKSNITCASSADIASAASATRLRLYYGNKYFDFNDIEKPIKTFLDFRVEMVFDPYFVNSYSLYIQKDHWTANDGGLPFSEDKEGHFYSMETVDRMMNMKQGSTLGFIDIFQSAKSYQYERKVFTLFELLGQVGGVHELLMVSLGILLNHYNSKKFSGSLLRSLQKFNVDSEPQEVEVSQHSPSQNLSEQDQSRHNHSENF